MGGFLLSEKNICEWQTHLHSILLLISKVLSGSAFFVFNTSVIIVTILSLSLSLSPVSLVVLVALNMLLFYKLYALERAAHTLETWHSYSVADR